MDTKSAVAELCKALKEDEGYWESWKANIAMAFQDEYHNQMALDGNIINIHKISNNAAENFLKLLTS